VLAEPDGGPPHIHSEVITFLSRQFLSHGSTECAPLLGLLDVKK